MRFLRGRADSRTPQGSASGEEDRADDRSGEGNAISRPFISRDWLLQVATKAPPRGRWNTRCSRFTPPTLTCSGPRETLSPDF